ncbi:hypothetical protein FRC17_000242 [Serendipita sp. 399]|nr:hypothetical protein FRC17_000242 [Serendipita sp. 399]
MSRRTDPVSETHVRPAGPVVSSTSGEAEREGNPAYAFSPRKKSRRKMIITNDVSRLTGQGVHSESALGSPSPPILHLPLLQTNFIASKEHTMNVEQPSIESLSPKRTSARRSPTKTSTVGPSDIVRSHGIPRTLTLPAHLTDTLMKMKITNDQTSVESLILDPSTPRDKVRGRANDEMDVDVVDAQTITSGGVGGEKVAPGRKQRTRKRARSLPPKPIAANAEDEECDADDEGGGPDAGNEEEGIMSPTLSIPTARKRGRIPVVGDDESEVQMQGMTITGVAKRISPGVPRRSARRLTVGGTTGIQKTLAERLGMIISPIEENMPRKRARTREGREGSSAAGEEEDGRSRKKTRKR